MDAAQLKKIEILPLIGYELKKAGGYHIGACPFCGGKDRFTVKHTPAGDRWHCRHCGEDKYHDAIDFIMRRDGVNFTEACTILGGDKLYRAPKNTTSIHPETPKTIELPDQGRFIGIMDMAADDLLTADGVPAQEYLYSRGILPAAWYAWHLGAAIKHGRPAITIPWYYINSKREYITAIKYRFIDELAKDKDHRYTSEAGSVFVMYGAWDIMPTDDTLIIVEGEINALSIWQCRAPGLSVISLGSEGGGREEVIRETAKRYKRVFVWCDKVTKTREHIAALQRPAQALQSPKIDGVEIDANSLLIAGQLEDFIARVIYA